MIFSTSTTCCSQMFPHTHTYRYRHTHIRALTPPPTLPSLPITHTHRPRPSRPHEDTRNPRHSEGSKARHGRYIQWALNNPWCLMASWQELASGRLTRGAQQGRSGPGPIKESRNTMTTYPVISPGLREVQISRRRARGKSLTKQLCS